MKTPRYSSKLKPFIVSLTAPEAADDAPRFGPKAANLARLLRAGFPVPKGFCLDALPTVRRSVRSASRPVRALR